MDNFQVLEPKEIKEVFGLTTDEINSLSAYPEVKLGIPEDTIEITGYFSDPLYAMFENDKRQTIEFQSNIWFMPKWKCEAIVSQYDAGSIKGDVVDGTHEDMTDYRIHAKLLRWTYNKSGVFRWICTKVYNSKSDE